MIDYFGKNADELKNKKLFLLDMDGTIYNDETLFEGTLQFLKFVKDQNGKYLFITNNSSKSVDDYIKKLNRIGIDSCKEDFFTSTQATIMMLKDKYPNKKVFVMATKSFVKELRENNICVSEEVEEDIDLIVMGFDRELNYQKLERISKLLQEKNISYYATNPDLRCPCQFGYVPDCGSFAQMLKNTTGKSPIYIGKPEPTMIFKAMDKYGYSKEQTVVIGDRLYTDIESGVNAGVTTICVLTGEATIKDIENYENKPTFVFEGIKDLLPKTN